VGKKLKYIETEAGIPPTIIGIASNERIWKICWEINQVLDLNLTAARQNTSPGKAPDVYHDSGGRERESCSLFEQSATDKKIPALARKFRFWLVIRPAAGKQNDAGKLLKKLSGISSISLVADLSAEKEINRFLP